MNQWERLLEYFFGIVKHPRNGHFAREMVKVIIMLRDEPELRRARIQAKLLYITIQPVVGHGEIIIHNEGVDSYVISVVQYKGKDRVVEDDHGVQLEFVPSLVIFHLHRLQENTTPKHHHLKGE